MPQVAAGVAVGGVKKLHQSIGVCAIWGGGMMGIGSVHGEYRYYTRAAAEFGFVRRRAMLQAANKGYTIAV